MNQEAVEASIAAASSKLSYTAAGTLGVAGWMTSDIVFGLIGVLIGAATWAVNAHYKRKADKRKAEYERLANERQEREFRLRMRKEFGTDWGDL
ncbi:holin [Comamonas odontotermitis]|uniref:holin n=1 Tax=Comamonas odontotermitis TaxID=379895 RepID=UPI00366E8F8E